MLDKLANFLTGGLADKVVDTVKDYFPPDMSEEQKANMTVALKELELKQTIEVNKAIADAEQAINQRIAEHEGTAKDLMALPIVGRILIFARGCQRPIWGFATLYMDYMWFSNKWASFTIEQEATLWLINLLVLGFLFGERAIKNLQPVIIRIIDRIFGRDK